MKRPDPFLLTVLAVAGVAALGVVWVHGAPARELAAREEAWGFRISNGDLVFQDLECGVRCQLIRDVTKSPYSHVGIVIESDGGRVVWEAYHPVGPTPLAEFVSRGRDRKVGIYRLGPTLQPGTERILAAVRAMKGLPYDGNYQWDDERIYCSELVAKAVQRAIDPGLLVAKPSPPGSFGVHKAIITKMSKGTLSEQTPLVSPRDLIASGLFEKRVDELARGPSR